MFICRAGEEKDQRSALKRKIKEFHEIDRQIKHRLHSHGETPFAQQANYRSILLIFVSVFPKLVSRGATSGGKNLKIFSQSRWP